METLTDPSEPPDESGQVPSFDAHQYSFFTSNTSPLEELEEGVMAPPEEIFNCADSDINSISLLDTFEEIDKGPLTESRRPLQPEASPPQVLSVKDLEKNLQSMSIRQPAPMTVTQLEAQLRGAAVQFPIRQDVPMWMQSSPSSSVLNALVSHHGDVGPHFLSESRGPLRPIEYGVGGGGGGVYSELPPMLLTQQKYKFMSVGEIDKILAFQAQNAQVQNPYSDDYYYKAFMKKYRRGAVKFCPLSMKELEHQAPSMKAEVKFADLQGLGKIPFSNLRTPRPLIDYLDNESLASAEEEAGLQSIHWEYIRSAQRAQAMHARKLIEDSMCLLLEVDDVDRLAMSECGKVDLRKLAARRRGLIGSIVGALRIPGTPEGLPTEGLYNSDGVFLRLMSMAKGRSLLAKLLNVLVPPRPFQALPTDTKPLSCICWATLRNIRALFGPTTWITKAGVDVDISSLTAETSKIAMGLKEVILALKTASDVCMAFEALAKGDLMSSDGTLVTPEEMLLPFLPPNHVPGCKTGIWLEAVLVALLQRALEVGLANRIGFAHPTGEYADYELVSKWEYVFGVLYDALTAHLRILVQVHHVAKERNQPQALEYAKGLLGKDLLSATLMLCNQLQFSRVKQIVNALLEW